MPKVSSFEPSRGYLPSFVGLPQIPTSKVLIDAHREQQAKRAISRMLRSRIPKVIKTELSRQKTPVYNFVKESKQGKWKLGFVAESQDHMVSIMTNSQGRGHRLKVAYEDIRLVPKSALLYDLQQLEPELDTTDNQRLPMDVEDNVSADPSPLEEQEPCTEGSADPLYRKRRNLIRTVLPMFLQPMDRKHVTKSRFGALIHCRGLLLLDPRT